jgi:hypothetical protein
VTAPGDLADRASPPGTADLRIVLMQALGILTPRARAVVVLRYWEDRSIDQVAALLGCSAGSVTSQSARRGSPAGRRGYRRHRPRPVVGPRRRRPGGGGEGRRVMDGDPGQRSNGAALVPLRGPAGSGFVAHAQQLRLGGDSGQAWH